MESAAKTEPGAKPLPLWKRAVAHLRKRIDGLLAEHASPERLGWAVFVGVMCGCSSLIGFQFLASLLLAWILRLNKVAVMIGLQISAPPITPFMILAELQLGELILRGKLLKISLEMIRTTPNRDLFKLFFIDLTVGGLVMGVVLGAALGVATARFVKRRHARELSARAP